MANEIQIGIQLTFENGKLKTTFLPGTLGFDQAALGMFQPVVTVASTGEEDMTFTDISTLGWVVGRNLDDTNYVVIGPSTGAAKHDFLRVEAGEPFAFRLEPGITWRWQANTAPVKMQLIALED